MTSRRAVDIVARRIGTRKVGHAGTLDPLATGVLVLGVGRATRLVEFVQRMPKRYSGTFLLGRTSPTEDTEGEMTLLTDPPIPTLDQLVGAATKWTGTVEQRPPAYSALKIAGRRAYDLARQGETFDLAPRPITIHELTIAEYDYPRLALDIVCGSGTYVRSLGRDLAESLGTGAVMCGLTRTAIGDFRLEDAVAPEDLTEENLAAHLLPARCAVVDLPELTLTEAEAVHVLHGRSIERDDVLASGSDCFAGIAPDGTLLAILVQHANGEISPKRVFPANSA